jgi:hypothetical protein
MRSEVSHIEVFTTAASGWRVVGALIGGLAAYLTSYQWQPLGALD